MSDDLLIILNPRKIEECTTSYAELGIDKLWISWHTEMQIEERWNEILKMAEGYDHLLVVSDDVVVRPPALDAVQRLLEQHEVVTGYCNLSFEDMRVNLSKSPLATEEPSPDAYDLPDLAELMQHPQAAYRTYFAGMCLTAMSHDMWTAFPFCVTAQGGQSDFHLSRRLCEASVPMVAAREGFCWHVKERWNMPDREPRKKLYTGVLEPELLLDR